MKKVALTVAVLALGLAACEKKEETTIVENNVAVENVETDVNAADAATAADNALDAAGNAVEDAGNAVENAADSAANAADNAM